MRPKSSARKTKLLKLAPETIGFRLRDEARAVLQERASEGQVSPHEVARRYVLEKLQEAEDHKNLVTYLEALYGEVARLREEVATTIEVLLVSVAKVDKRTAHNYIEENFKQ